MPSDRQKLIDKYQSHFDTASITSELIEDESNLRYLIEHNILQDLQSKFLIIKVDSSQKEFYRLVEETAQSPHLNPGTNVRIELF